MISKIKATKKKLSIFFIIGILILIIVIYSFFSKTSIINQDLNSKKLEAKFLYLSNAGTNFCAGPDIIDKYGEERLQGSCCSAMDFHKYEEQIEGLKKFSYIEEIPEDPYDISSEWANKYINYFETKELTFEQQKIYDEAMKMSMEGGPCCCKCWRWYAYGGLAKYLIIKYGFTSEQIAEVWNLSDGCGGSGHINGGGH